MKETETVVKDGIYMSKWSAAGMKAWETRKSNVNEKELKRRRKPYRTRRKSIFKLRARLQAVTDELMVISEELGKYEVK